MCLKSGTNVCVNPRRSNLRGNTLSVNMVQSAAWLAQTDMACVVCSDSGFRQSIDQTKIRLWAGKLVVLAPANTPTEHVCRASTKYSWPQFSSSSGKQS